VYHVHTRGNRKGSIFQDDADREQFMELVAEGHQRYGVRYYGACLMGTHYHIVVETPRGNLSEVMRHLNGRYTELTNARHELTGHLFGGRFSAHVIERDRYLRRSIRYLALNPVEGGLVSDPADWPWSTYSATAGLTPCPEWLTNDWLPWAFDVGTLTEAQTKFVKYVHKPRKREVIDWKKIAFGTSEFEAAMAEVARRRRAERRMPRPAASAPPPSLETIFATFDSLPQRDRLVELAHKKYGYRLADISRHLNLDCSAGARILRRVSARKS
jgi:REP element-mobilizing transposase RayT